MATDAVTHEPAVITDPEIQGGHAVIRGTRVPVHVLVSALADGAGFDEVCEAYGVTETDVRAALAYAAVTIKEECVVAIPR